MSSNLKAFSALFIGTLMFGFGIAMRAQINPWLSNTLAAVVVLVLSAMFWGERIKKRIVFHKSTVLASLGLALLMVVVTHLSFMAACHIFPGLENEVKALYADIAREVPGPFVTVALILTVVVAEEVLWRGVAMDLCQQRFGSLVSWALVVALYTLPQLIGGNWILIAAAIIAGGIFTAQRLWWNGLTAPLITHGIWSSCVFCLVPLV